jgi:hypothetical protein
MHHTEGLAQTLAKIKRDKNAVVIINGDLQESIMVDDKRFQMEVSDPDKPTPLIQLEYLVKLLKPIASKIVAINDGNHELKLRNFGFLTKYLCERLGIPEAYGTWSSVITFVDEKDNVQFKAFVAHSCGGSLTSTADDPIRRESNLRLSVKRKTEGKFGDCLVMAVAHYHKLIISPPTKKLYLMSDEEKITQHYTKAHDTSGAELIHPDHRWYICSGSFLRTYGEPGVSGYAEIAGYDPVELGYIKMTVRNGEIKRAEKVIL